MIDILIVALMAGSGWCFYSMYLDWRKLRKPMSDNGPRYDHAAKVAATIINLPVNSDDQAAIKYGKILFLVLDAMYEAERELAEMRHIVSRN
jgi:hypothetical protein